MLWICNMRDTKDGVVSMAGLGTGTLGHCHASIAARKRAPVAQGDASSPVTSVNKIRHRVQMLVLSLQCIEVHSNGSLVSSTFEEHIALYILSAGYALSYKWLRSSRFKRNELTDMCILVLPATACNSSCCRSLRGIEAIYTGAIPATSLLR
jgi:hypothetical protein